MARQTPRGARPNRRGGLARPVAPISQENGVCFARASAQSNQPSGRLLESRREPGPRGMIATAKYRRTKSGLQAHPPIFISREHFTGREANESNLRKTRLSVLHRLGLRATCRLSFQKSVVRPCHKVHRTYCSSGRLRGSSDCRIRQQKTNSNRVTTDSFCRTLPIPSQSQARKLHPFSPWAPTRTVPR